MRVDFLFSENQFYSTRRFMEELKKGFQELGVATRSISCWPHDVTNEAVMQMLHDPSEWAISFCRISMSMQDGQEAWLPELINTKVLFYWIDATLYGLPALKSEHGFLSSVDRYEAEFYSKIAARHVPFFPHGIPIIVPNEAERPYDIVMCANFLPLALRGEWKSLFGGYEDALERIADHVLIGKLPLPDAFAKEGIWMDMKLYMYLEQYVKARERIQLLKMVAPRTVHLFGPKEWGVMLDEMPHVILHDEISYEESLDVMSQAKIVLNSSPQFRYGSHERVFGGLMAGASVLTTENPYLLEEFKGNEALGFFTFHDRDGVHDFLNRRLNGQREGLKEIREDLLQRHTWKARAKDLLKFFETPIE